MEETKTNMVPDEPPVAEEPKEAQGSDADVFTLPCGILKDGVIHRGVALEPMTGAVTKELGRRDVRSSPARIVNTVLRRCLVEIEGIGGQEKITQQILNDMLVADRDYCFFMARKVTFGSLVERIAACPVCGLKNHLTLDIDSLAFKPLAESDYTIEDGERIFEMQSPEGAKKAWTARCRYPNGNDQQVLSTILATNIIEAEQHMVWRCLKQLSTAASTERAPFPKDLFDHVRLDIVNDIMAAFKAKMPGIDDMADATCVGCGESFKVDFGPDFLLQTSGTKTT